MIKKEVFAWGMYDLANTIFSALYVTFFFPFFIKEFLGGDEFQIGLVFSLSMVVVGIIVPLIGAWSDALGRRLPFVFWFTLICCAMTWLTGLLSLTGALIAAFVANVCYHAALTTYNALLPKIAAKNEQGRVSGIGVGMGYAGTVVALIAGVIVLSQLGWETKIGAQAMFVTTAVLFFTLSLFIFMIPEKKQKVHGAVIAGFKSVWQSLRSMKPQLIKFLLAMFFFANAMNAVILFLFLYAREQVNLSVQAFFVVYAVQAAGAMAGSIASGFAVDKFGPKRVLVAAGLLWIAVIAALLVVKSTISFVVLGCIGGIALGTVWTAQRPKLLSLIQEKKSGQYFGFLELANKFSGVFGPLIFGAAVKFANYSVALMSLIVFFLIGLLLLRGDANAR